MTLRTSDQTPISASAKNPTEQHVETAEGKPAGMPPLKLTTEQTVASRLKGGFPAAGLAAPRPVLGCVSRCVSEAGGDR